MEYQIRKASKKDLPDILKLVIELAVYEKEPEAVTATLHDYEENFEAGIFDAFVAEYQGKIIGMALFYLTYSTWKGRMLYLEDFVVTQSHRRTGIGKQIFESVVQEAKFKQAKRMKWQVLDWNEPAINFYKKYDVSFDEDWLTCDLYF